MTDPNGPGTPGDPMDPDAFFRAANRSAGEEYGRQNFERILWRHRVRRLVGLAIGLSLVVFVLVYLERH